MRGSSSATSMTDQERQFAREIAKEVLDTIEPRLQMHFEGVQQLVKVAADGYAGTLESIDRRLDRLEKKADRHYRLHSAVLKDNGERIDTLEKR